MTIKVNRQLNEGPKIQKEQDIVTKMIRIYCKKNITIRGFATNVRI